MIKLIRKIRDRLFSELARKSDLDNLYNQISGLLQIQNAMNGKRILQPLRGWAISPDAMAWVLSDLQQRNAPVLIEFGSGQSTVILASCLQSGGVGRLFSVEHDENYLNIIKRQVEACGLLRQVEFFHAPIRAMNDGRTDHSYDLTVLPDIKIDLALVDGPPMQNGVFARLTPLRWAIQHLKPGGVIFLDDSARDAEQACLRKLLNEHPSLRSIPRTAEKGLIELRMA